MFLGRKTEITSFSFDTQNDFNDNKGDSGHQVKFDTTEDGGNAKHKGNEDESDEDDDDDSSDSDDDNETEKKRKEEKEAMKIEDRNRMERRRIEHEQRKQRILEKQLARKKLNAYRALSRFKSSLEYSTEDEKTNTETLEKKYGYNFDHHLSGKKLLDKVCNIWHILFLFLSMVLVMLGVLLRWFFGNFIIVHVQSKPSFTMYSSFVTRASSGTRIYFSGVIQEIGLYLVIINSAFVLCALSYMVYPLHKFSFTVPVMCLIGGVFSLVETGFISVKFDADVSKDIEEIKRLQDKLTAEYRIKGANEFSISYDYLSIWLQCCGIADRHDFINVTLEATGSLSAENTLQVPPSCCKGELFEKKGEKGQMAILECASNAKPINSFGCFATLIGYLRERSRIYIACAAVHILDLVIHAFLYRHRIRILEKALEERFGFLPHKKKLSDDIN